MLFCLQKFARAKKTPALQARFCKALASLVIICPKKILQESVDHPSNIQPPDLKIKVSPLVKIMFFKHFFFMEVNCMPSNLNYFLYKGQSTISPNHFKRYLEVK